MKISVIGCGYLGAVHAVCMAHVGHDVVGVDVDPGRVAQLNSGVAPFYEPEFEGLLHEGLAAGKLRFVDTTVPGALADAEVFFITVGTPQKDEAGHADVSHVEAAVELVLDALAAVGHGAQGRESGRGRRIIVGKSTVPAGTARAVAQRVEARVVQQLMPPVDVVWNPEFLREGHAVADTLRPDRIVLGQNAGQSSGTPSAALATLDELYTPMYAQGAQRVVTDFATAELVKVAANSFLATKISFINAMAQMCEATGGDVVQLAQALGMDERIGPQYLTAGIGYGGGCLPKDVRALTAHARQLGVGEAAGLLAEVERINSSRAGRVVERCRALVGSLDGVKVAVLGGAFKAGSDDIRQSQALAVAAQLQRSGARVSMFDPQAGRSIAAHYPQFEVGDSVERVLAGAELVLVLTEWQEFSELDPHWAGDVVAAKKVFDGRAVLDPQAWREAGWEYVGIGRQ